MRTSVNCAAAALVVSAFNQAASASFTIATFADPAPGAVSTLFQFNSGTGVLSGGWTGTGLLLETSGLPATPDYPNATFSMTPLQTISSIGPTNIMGPGQINFFDSSNAPLLTISFAGAFLTSTVSLGASDFVGFAVTFSGPMLAVYPPTFDEAFAFSFANPTPSFPFGSYTATSSFTSSASFAPAPGTAAAFGIGALVTRRRRPSAT